MELIIKDDTFDSNRITIKNGKNTKKIIYELDTISIIGLTFKVNQYIIVNQSKRYIYIDIDNSPQKKLFLLIDNYFKEKLRFYQTFIDNSILKIKKHNTNIINHNDNLYISINNIKKKDIYNVQIFTI
tara:strand:+ start:1015 stop:1398 length:384 start_codon:yes stop_codon:yes gene_type:complete